MSTSKIFNDYCVSSFEACLFCSLPVYWSSVLLSGCLIWSALYTFRALTPSWKYSWWLLLVSYHSSPPDSCLYTQIHTLMCTYRTPGLSHLSPFTVPFSKGEASLALLNTLGLRKPIVFPLWFLERSLATCSDLGSYKVIYAASFLALCIGYRFFFL